MIAGAGTMLWGANEIATGVTGTNYIQEWTGMSDGLYYGLGIGLNVVSLAGQIAGNAYINHMTTTGIKTPGQARPYSRYVNTKGQTITHYDKYGNMSWSKHLTNHGYIGHGTPHWHFETPHSRPINSRWQFIWQYLFGR